MNYKYKIKKIYDNKFYMLNQKTFKGEDLLRKYSFNVDLTF